MILDALRELMRERSSGWGAEVRRLREERDLTQQQLVELVDGLSVQTISQIERGAIIPRDYLKCAVATALGTEPSDLFGLPSAADVRQAAS